MFVCVVLPQGPGGDIGIVIRNISQWLSISIKPVSPMPFEYLLIVAWKSMVTNTQGPFQATFYLTLLLSDSKRPGSWVSMLQKWTLNMKERKQVEFIRAFTQGATEREKSAPLERDGRGLYRLPLKYDRGLETWQWFIFLDVFMPVCLRVRHYFDI